MKDLVVLAADKNIEAALSKLLTRHQALSIRELSFDLFVHPRRDPGCYHEGAAFLMQRKDAFQHGLVVFDQAWDGAPSRDEQCNHVKENLARYGMDVWADVIVIDPEIEAWVFSDSPHVDACLGWERQDPSLRTWLVQQNHLSAGSSKPHDPKGAVEALLRQVRMPRSSSIYSSLAARVSLERCVDPSFQQLKERLQQWFPRGS